MNGNDAILTHICAGKAYYQIRVLDEKPDEFDNEETIYQLEINTIDEEWKATYLYPSFRAITLMRWIRKGIENNDETFIQISK